MKLLEKYLNILESDDIEEHMNVAGAVITKIDPESGEHFLLLIQRAADDHWPLHYEIPRGKCDVGPNEGLEECCIRETKEETGLDIEIINMVDKFSYLADKGKRRSTQYNFLCKMKNQDQKIKLSKEHDSYKWISSVGEAELLVLPELKKTIAKVLDIDQSIVNYPDDIDLEIAEAIRNNLKGCKC